MSVLLMQLYGQLQSYGSGSKFTVRDTELWPTKSAVVGMLAAAQGRKRGDDISDLSGLRYGVRIDRPGRVQSDFHTVQQAKYDTRKGITQDPIVSTRRYVADAGYLVAVEGEKQQLEELFKALQKPVYMVALGRRACVPSRKVALGVYDYDTVEEALQDTPCTDTSAEGGVLECVVEDPNGNIRLKARPKTFDENRRRYGSVTMRRYWVTLDDAEEPQEEPAEAEEKEPNTPTRNGGFDPMSLFGSKEEETNTPTGYDEPTAFDPMSMFGGEQ